MSNFYHRPPRSAAKCCGCCCDYRRAVIIVCIVWMALDIVQLVFVASGNIAYLHGASEFKEEYEDHVEKYLPAIYAILAISIVACGLAILGAIKFNIYLVGANVVSLVIYYISDVVLTMISCVDWENNDTAYEDYQCSIGLNIFALAIRFVVVAACVYPHMGFIMEVRKGILSQETYPREQYSCCCMTATTHEYDEEVAGRVKQAAPVPPTEQAQIHDTLSSAVNETIKVSITYGPHGEKITTEEVTHGDGTRTVTETIEETLEQHGKHRSLPGRYGSQGY